MQPHTDNLHYASAELLRRDPRTARPSWLTEAYADAGGFWSRFGAELVASAPGAPRSAVFEWYDLFYEFGERHAVAARAALRDYSPSAGFQDVCYTTIVQRAQRVAAAWAALGVGPGSTVCVVLEPSAAYVICMLAAWCCGAAVTIVPPDGPSFVRQALAAAGVVPKPKPGVPPVVFVAAGATARPWLLQFEPACLLTWEARPGQAPYPSPHRFAADAIAARLFSPLGVAWAQPVELSAEQLYLSALRDGLMLMQILPGEAIAAPGFSDLHYKPALLLMALACGATWVQFDMQELGDGSPLLGGKIDVLGITTDTRALLLSNPRLGQARLRRWFRNPAEEAEVTAWDPLHKALAPLGIASMNYFTNAAAGGSILFSGWSVRAGGAGVWLTPGLPCELAEPNGTGMPPLADVAMLVPGKFPERTPGIQRGLPEQAIGRIVLCTHPKAEDVFVGNLGSHRSGTVLPELQLEEVLKSRFPDEVRAAVLVALPMHSGSGRPLAALLVFLWPSATPITSTELSDHLRSELGAERTPDRVEVFSLNPKLVDPKLTPPVVDRASCRAQYISGSLWGKSRLSVFRELASLFCEVTQFRDYVQLRAREGGA
jgi:hypothetical protein